MYEEHEQKETDYIKNTRIIIGGILLLIGVIIGVWTFLKIYNIFEKPETFSRFKVMAKEIAREVIINENGKKIEFSEGFFYFFVFIIPLALLGISSSLAGIFIAWGVNLIHSSLLKLDLKLESVKNKLDRLNEKISRR